MKICLVLHKYSVSIHDPCCFPLGFMHVSSHFKALGHTVKVLNYNLWDYDLKSEIKNCDIVCFTGFEEFKPYILRDEKICREIGKYTIVGGALATFGGIPEFQGEKFKGEIEQGPIDVIPWPDYDGFGVDEYNKRHAMRYIGVLTTRGCPYSCTFCAQTCKFRMKDLRAVFAEISHYKSKYKAESVVFNDNTLNINKPRFLKLCEGMKTLGLVWGGAIRCQPFDDDMGRAAKDSGASGFVVGVESLRQEKLDRLNKKIKVRQITKAMDVLNKYQIPYHGNILLGFEDETMEDIQKEMSSIPKKYNLLPAMVQPFIGTKNAKTRKITNREYDLLNGAFLKIANDRNKTYNSVQP